jgi:hypothetical protein
MRHARCTSRERGDEHAASKGGLVMSSVRFSAAVFVVLFGCFGCSGGHSPDGDGTDAHADASSTPGPVGPARAPDGGHDDGISPPTCTAEKDCANACPPGTKGCTCAQTPNGGLCIPTCETDADCPARPTGALTCSPQKTCTPKDH